MIRKLQNIRKYIRHHRLMWILFLLAAALVLPLVLTNNYHLGIATRIYIETWERGHEEEEATECDVLQSWG